MSRKDFKGIYPALGRYSIKNKKNGIYYYVAYMLNRTQQMFKYSGLPETIPQRNLELLLQINGYAAIAEADGDIYAFFGGLGGVPDAYYMPTLCIVNNPALNFSKDLKIDVDTVIITNDDMYAGLVPMFTKYAELLVENDITFRSMSINARLATILSASDDVTKEAAKKYLKDLEDGEIGIIGEGAFFDGIKSQPAASAGSQKVIDLIEYNQYLKASWLNDIGIEANYNMKREALGSDEVKLNIKALLPLAENMLECRKKGVEKVNAMFGTDISVEFSGVWEDTAEEVENMDQITEEPEQPEDDNNDVSA